MIDQLKSLAKIRVNNTSFEENWGEVLATYDGWKSIMVAHQTSSLNSHLELLKIICKNFPDAHLYKNKEISDLILSDSGVKDVGHEFKCPLPNGSRAEMTKIVGREITERFGILYTLETFEGFRFTREFFD